MRGRWRWFCGAGLLALLPARCGAEKLCGGAPRPAGASVRPDIKRTIDRMAGYPLALLVQTTDSAASAAPARRTPSDPKPFPAGTVKVVFEGANEAVALWVNTEERVGHYSTVTPGATDTGGWLRLGRDGKSEASDGPRLNDEEMDYLLAMLYSRFCKPLDAESAARLNQVKDMALAVRFGARPGLGAYHAQLLRELK